MKLRTRPSARPSQRYLALRVHSSAPLRFENLKAAALNQLLEWLGEDEFAKAGLRFIKNLWDPGAADDSGVSQASVLLQCHPRFTERVKLGLALLAQVGDSRVTVSCVRVGGTIRSAAKGPRRIERSAGVGRQGGTGGS